MRHQGAFYFKRADTVAGTFDNIVGTAHEPEVTVFITPGDIARVIQAVVPCFACAFGIPVIFLEKTDRFAICSVDHDLSLFSVFGTGSVRAQQVYIVLRIRDTHRSGFRFHPRESGDGQGCFRLSETFHQLDAGQFVERVEYGRV